LQPDAQLLCYDFPYYVGSHRPFEIEEQIRPAWRFVGKHLHWAPQIQALGDAYLRRAFGLGPKDRVPPYIALHVRRQDFYRQCKFRNPPIPIEECFAPLSAYARRVDQIRAALATSPKHNFTTGDAQALPVVITSDEKSPAFWDEVAQLGWTQLNHTTEGTVQKYGLWYEIILDVYAQGSGVGFVGTVQSTMSMLAARRVEDWRGGVTREVNWGGRKDAD